MLVVWKGVHVIEEPHPMFMVTLVLSIGGGAALLSAFFMVPYLWRRIIVEDWPLKWHMAWRGPFLLRRPAPPPTPPGTTNTLNIRNYNHDHLTPEELAYVRESDILLQSVQTIGDLPPTFLDKDDFALPPPAQSTHSRKSSSNVRSAQQNELAPPRPPGRWHNPRVIQWKLARILLRGLEKDVVRLQKTHSVLSWDIADMHSRAARFDNRAEGAYASLQVLTAAAASFVHGANDVSNSVAPLATAYEVWMRGEVTMSVGVPIWILCFGGGAIVLGLVTYGYHVMRNLGNRLTLISPSRGFCMELATAITVLMATKLQLPVSVSFVPLTPHITLHSLPPSSHTIPMFRLRG
ncbi:inorganic phosphate transporter [Candidatus Bathyarchaeota archaeon]|nr:inorganic phosphate transporter [Candidatus Bathyarchaeota archaeon]